jgi:hypothetical protein
MTDKKECTKCAGLFAAFGFNGLVKVADQYGRVEYGDEINQLYYGDFYENKDYTSWPECPSCKRSLDLYTEMPGDEHKSPKAFRLAFFAAVVISAIFWRLVYGYFMS